MLDSGNPIAMQIGFEPVEEREKDKDSENVDLSELGIQTSQSLLSSTPKIKRSGAQILISKCTQSSSIESEHTQTLSGPAKFSDFYKRVESRYFDLHKFIRIPTREEVHNHVRNKYTFEECSQTQWFTMYHTPMERRKFLWGFEILEALSVQRPLPACSKKNPKLLEPGLQVFLKLIRPGEKNSYY